MSIKIRRRRGLEVRVLYMEVSFYKYWYVNVTQEWRFLAENHDSKTKGPNNYNYYVIQGLSEGEGK